MKDKRTAIIRAAIGGFLGLDKFYLGKKGTGIVMAFIGVPLLVGGFIGAVVMNTVLALNYYLMSQENFDKKYNSQAIQREILNAIKDNK